MSVSFFSPSVRVQCAEERSETVFLLSGHDQRIHLYKEVSGNIRSVHSDENVKYLSLPYLCISVCDIVSSKSIYLLSSVHPKLGRGGRRLFHSHWVSLRISSQLGMPRTPPKGGAHPARCSNHLNWLLLTYRSHRPTLRSLWMSELHTLSLRLSPAILRRKLICDQTISVVTQISGRR